MKYALIGFLAFMTASLWTAVEVGFRYPINPENKTCVSRSQLEEWMDDNQYSLLWRGQQANSKWLEVWTDFENRDNIMVEFDNPSSQNMHAIGESCIFAMTQRTTWNIKSMRKFIDWYENLTKAS